MCDMTCSHVWRDSFVCVTWLIHMCDMTHSYVRHDSFIYVTWLIHVCDMTHSCVTWLICTCDVTHVYVWRDLSIRVTWLFRMHVKWLDEYEYHDSFIRVSWLIHTYAQWLVHTCDVTHLSCDVTCSHVSETTQPHVWYDSQIGKHPHEHPQHWPHPSILFPTTSYGAYPVYYIGGIYM